MLWSLLRSQLYDDEARISSGEAKPGSAVPSKSYYHIERVSGGLVTDYCIICGEEGVLRCENVEFADGNAPVTW